MPDAPVEPEAAAAADPIPETVVDAPSAPAVADEVLLNAASVARSALLEITPERTIGKVAGHLVEGERVLSLLFENRLPGYPGWYWTVSLSREDGSDRVNVLETELTPGDAALLAPEWVPWSQRLAEYQAQQKALREAAAAAGEELPDDEFAVGDDADDEDGHYADDELEEHELEEEELLDELEDDDFEDADGDEAELDEPDDEDDADADFEAADDITGAEEAALDEGDDDDRDDEDEER